MNSFVKIALSGNGRTVTPYGVVYKFDGTMDEIYDGRHFPQYDYRCDNILIVGLKSKNEPPETENVVWLYMPMPDVCMEKALIRVGEDTFSDVDGLLPDGLMSKIRFEDESMRSLNDMCKAVCKFSESDLQKLDAVADYAKAYQSGDAIPTGKPNYTVLLQVTKGYFNDPEYDSDLSAFLKLPADVQALCRAAEEVEAASLKECAFTAVDCVIPRLTEKITDDLEATNGESYNMVNELAGQLRYLDREGSIPTYKAMLEAAPDDISLEDSHDLGYQSEGFALMREAVTPADYAKAELDKCAIPLKEKLFADASLYHYGEKLVEHNKAVPTDYGILTSRNGQTVEQCLVRPDRNMDVKENDTNQETADLGGNEPVMGEYS